MCVSHMRVLVKVPKRCKRREENCSLSGKRVWYNYTSQGTRDHPFTWPANATMEYFFLYEDWGVTCRWLRQHTQRMAFQYVAFSSEAAVHMPVDHAMSIDSAQPHRPDIKIKEAWYMWRVVVRTFQYNACHAPDNKVQVNLIAPLTSVLRDVWRWYPDFMFKRRVGALARKGIVVNYVVIDGNAKLCRRFCARV